MKYFFLLLIVTIYFIMLPTMEGFKSNRNSSNNYASQQISNLKTRVQKLELTLYQLINKCNSTQLLTELQNKYDPAYNWYKEKSQTDATTGKALATQLGASKGRGARN